MKNNLIHKLVGLITNNIGLKLLAVIVSCGLWFVVNSITDPVERKLFNNIQVEIVNEDLITNESKVYEIIDNTNTVNVWVTGKRSVLTYLTKDDIRAVADMAEITFMNTVAIEISSARNNSDLEFTCNTENLKLSIEDMKRVQMTISTSTSGKPDEGYVVGSVSPSQNVVRLSGPESLINEISRVEAVANIDGYSSDINTSVELKLYDADNNEVKSNSIKMNISTINVAVTILAVKEVPLSFTISGEPADRYVANGQVISEPTTVLLAGKKSTLDTINRLTIADPALSIEDATEDVVATVNIRKYLPSGTQFADSSYSGNVSVTIGIEPLETRELEIPYGNFAAGNKPENLKLTIREFDVEEPQSYKIRISGTQSAVEAINAQSVIGVVDMNLLLQSLEMDEWKEGVYTGEITFNLPDNVKLEGSYSLTIVLEAEETGDEEE